MRKIIAVVAAVAFVFGVWGCAVPYNAPVYGGLVTNNVKGPVAGVDNSVGTEKMGVAQADSIIFFAKGDCSIAAAMEAGGLTKVHHVDCEVFSILGIYATYKTIVHGE